MGSWTYEGKKHIAENGMGTMYFGLLENDPENAAPKPLALARVAVSDWTFAKSSDDVNISNTNAIGFAGATGSDVGKHPLHLGIYSAATGGTLLGKDDLALVGGGTPAELTSGQVVRINAGGFTAQLT